MALNVDSAVDFAQDTSGTFPGLCDRFVGRAYGFQHSGYESAWKHWGATPKKYRREGDKNPPIGALVFWNNSVGDGFGHVAIVTGKDKNGRAIVTSTHSNGGTPMEFPLASVMPNAYVGWSIPYFHGKTPDLDQFDPNGAAEELMGQAEDTNLYGMGTDRVNKGDLRREWGIAASVLKQFPEVDQVLKRVIAEGITDPAVIARMIGETNWAQRHTAEWMNVEKSRLSKDPALWQAQMERSAEQIMEAFAAKGATIDKATALKYADQLAHGSGWNGGEFEIYDKDWLNDKIAGAIEFHVDGSGAFALKGEAAEWGEKLNQAAYDFGIDKNDRWYQEWFKKTLTGLMAGEIQETQINDELGQRASMLNPWAADGISRGISVRAQAGPALVAIADEWGWDESQIDLSNDTVQAVLNNRDEKGNYKPMSPYEARLAARRSENWINGPKAKQEYTNIGQRILRDFGYLG